MKKICLISHCFDPIFAGYAKQGSRVARAVADRGIYDFVIVTRKFEQLPGKDRVNGFTVIRIGSPILDNISPQLGYLAFIIFLAWHLLFNARKYCILHCLSGFAPAGVAGILGKLFNLPTIIKIAQGEVRPRSSFQQKLRLNLWLLPASLADCFIVLSPESKEFLRAAAIPDFKIKHFTNGVDVNIFRQVEDQNQKNILRRKLNIRECSILVLYVGLIHPRKGIDLLLDAWENISRTIDQAFLLLIGPKGNTFKTSPCDDNTNLYQRSISERLNRKILQNTTEWRDQTPNINEYMMAADVFVLPSFAEGQPNVLLEAMASGLACIATDLSGIKDFIASPDHGTIVKQGSADALGKALSEMINKYPEVRRKMGRLSRKEIVKNCSIESVAITYEELYENLQSRIDGTKHSGNIQLKS
ncbi:glycosyl transferase group 1 [Desulfococcus multivorans DSM 2059]|uniref:Glycosyl transferase group 1 n=2 Tax=Desulfococcus multivorans TaxID=897 RepID=S7TBU1_DESML|nr:glycosyl transferase group 1 [Desulfococcus multivorans DSM 2059]SKA27440.1 Glycosyltransferase involved in cell wall bisynthesis [Desulfococcus multivorans DSM 2059]